MKKFFYPSVVGTKAVDYASLVLRVVFGFLMMQNHGLGKLSKLTGDGPIEFADPIGLGPGVSLFLTVFAEVLCSILLMAGLFTRAVVVPLAITMLVAIFVVHFGDPFKRLELAIIYLMGYFAIFMLGPGRISLDHLIFGMKRDG